MLLGSEKLESESMHGESGTITILLFVNAFNHAGVLENKKHRLKKSVVTYYKLSKDLYCISAYTPIFKRMNNFLCKNRLESRNLKT